MPNDPTLPEILRAYRLATGHEIRVALAGRVTRVDEVNRSVTVKVEQIPLRLDADGNATVRREPPSEIPDVPVMMSATARAETTLRLAPGDPGLLIFADYALGSWLDAGAPVPPVDSTPHGFSGAVFVPGLLNSGVSIPALGAGVEARIGLVGGESLEVLDTGTIVTTSSDIRLGSAAASDPVVLKNDLDLLEQVFTNWAVVPADGGAALKTLLTTLIGTGWPFGASKIKGE